MSTEALQTCPRCGLDEAQGEGFAPSDKGQRGKWCRACLRAATHYRQWRKGAVRWPFPIVYIGACSYCGGRRRAGKPGTFCSRPCKEAARRELLRARRLASKLARACLHCGSDMPQSMRSDAAYCSEACNQAAHNATRKASWKIGLRQERVSRAYIIERDGGRCHACGKKCRPDEIHLDHLIPLARGGTHAPENIRVACAACNLSRRDRGESQLLLVG